MLRSARLRFFTLLCCAGACSLAGCGGKSVKVNGKVVLPASVTLAPDDTLEVTLVPEDPAQGGVAGKVDPSTLAFTVVGNSSVKLPPGRYKVAVACYPDTSNPDAEKRSQAFAKLFGPFDISETPLQVELTADDEQQITVDLVKKMVTR
jgi:hypothetical protein